MSNVLELSAGTQGVDVQDRFAGLRKSSEGAQGFDIGPVIVTAVVLVITVVGARVLQRRAWRARLEGDRQRRREEEEQRRTRLEGGSRKQRFFLAESQQPAAFAETCAMADLLGIRNGVEGSLIAKEPGHASARVKVLGASDDGLGLAPHPEEAGHIPDGDVWLSVRQAGARRLYPITATRQPTGEHHDALRAAATGPGWKFSRLGQCDVHLHAIAIPVQGSVPPREEDAIPVRVLSIGFERATLEGPVSFEGGNHMALRIALPDEMDSVEFAARVRSQSRPEDGRKITDVVFDAVPRTTHNILARALARILAEDICPEPVQADS